MPVGSSCIVVCDMLSLVIFVTWMLTMRQQKGHFLLFAEIWPVVGGVKFDALLKNWLRRSWDMMEEEKYYDGGGDTL